MNHPSGLLAHTLQLLVLGVHSSNTTPISLEICHLQDTSHDQLELECRCFVENFSTSPLDSWLAGNANTSCLGMEAANGILHFTWMNIWIYIIGKGQENIYICRWIYFFVIVISFLDIMQIGISGWWPSYNTLIKPLLQAREVGRWPNGCSNTSCICSLQLLAITIIPADKFWSAHRTVSVSLPFATVLVFDSLPRRRS